MNKRLTKKKENTKVFICTYLFNNKYVELSVPLLTKAEALSFKQANTKRVGPIKIIRKIVSNYSLNYPW